MVEKVTKEERLATLMKEAAEKAIEILGNKDDFNKDDLSGKEVKATKPKAEKVADAKGGDEQADNRTSREVKKASNLLGQHQHNWKKISTIGGGKGRTASCDGITTGGGNDWPCNDPAEFICVNCATRVCAEHKNNDDTFQEI